MPKDKIVDEEGVHKPVVYTLLEDIGELSANENRKKRVTIGKWAKNPAKCDIRTWKKKKETGEWYPAKGISLSYEEVTELKSLMEKAEDQISEHEEAESKGKKKGGDKEKEKPTEKEKVKQKKGG